MSMIRSQVADKTPGPITIHSAIYLYDCEFRHNVILHILFNITADILTIVYLMLSVLDRGDQSLE